MRALALGVLSLTLAGGAPASAAAAAEVRASTTPATIGVGDVFTYSVETRVAAGSPEPQARDVRADVGAFRLVEPAQAERSEDDGLVLVRVTQRLACLDDGCVPTSGPRRITLPPARVRIGGTVVSSDPAAVVVRPRVAAANVTAGPRAYRRGTRLPPPEGPVGATTAVRVLAAAGLALAAVAVALAAGAALTFRRRRREDAVERAIRLLRESSSHPPPDRRVAADHLAQVVGRRAGVADDATVLAWSPSEPSGADAEALAARAARDSA